MICIITVFVHFSNHKDSLGHCRHKVQAALIDNIFKYHIHTLIQAKRQKLGISKHLKGVLQIWRNTIFVFSK